MRQWIGSALFWTMACRLLGTRPLSGPVLGYCQLEQTPICILFLSSPPSVAYMREWTGSALVRMMACRLFAPGLYLGQCWVIVNWNRFQFVSWFNHLPLVPHICVSESIQHCFGRWLVAYSAPGLCPGQCWVTVNWNRLQFVFGFYHLLLVSHICVSESVSIGSNDGLSPIRHQAICSGHSWVTVNWNMLQWNFNLNANLFISENASEVIVCEMVAFLPRRRWVKSHPDDYFPS